MSITRRGVLGAAAVAVSVGLALTGCSSGGDLTSSGGGSSATASASGDAKTLVVGSGGATESQILGYIYGGALADKGYKISYKPAIGERKAYLTSLQSGAVNLVPEYAGSLLSYLDASANAKSGADVKTALDGKVGTLAAVAYDFAPGADADSVTVTKAYADKHSLTSIADLKKVGSITLAANANFATRPDGLKGLKSIYGLDNIKIKAINDYGGPTTLKALLDGTVQAADIYTTTPSIKENNLVSLQDPKNLFASQQILPVVSKSKASDALGQILNGVSAKLTTEQLLELNTEVTGASKKDPQAAATAWLKANGF
jgi:osmoprotectant transport system substrate-binding protein